MSGGDVQPVLRCGQCNKPFDKQSTLKRHGYYCRSRRGSNTARTRSCTSCARAKARCDNKQPVCSRCIDKALGCHYPASLTKTSEPTLQRNDATLAQRRKVARSFLVEAPSVEDRQEAANDGDGILENTLSMPYLEPADVLEERNDWNIPDFDFPELWSSPTIEKTTQYHSSGPLSSAPRATTWNDQTFQTSTFLPLFNMIIPAIPSLTVRSLTQRQKPQTGARRVAGLAFHTLKSYPRMMLQHNALPPFIHPHWISSSDGSGHLEPLTNCMSLVHMISSGIQGSRKLFWKNVRLECERICEEHSTLNRRELLASMQALSIYILTRLDEGETEHNNLDFLLIATVNAIAQQFARIDVTSKAESASCNLKYDAGWEDWIFEESRRRLSVVYRVMDMLVYFDPAAMCKLQTDLVLAPLPAKKQLWEASDESTWKTESQREPRAQPDFALAANGELVKLEGGQGYCGDSKLLYKSLDASTPPRRADHWEEWCSGMDGFGGLVMLAASLVV